MNDKQFLCVERAYVFMPNAYVIMKVNLLGNPSKDIVKDAIIKSINTNEILKCKIVIKNNGQVVYEKMDRAKISFTVSNKHWGEIIKEQEKIRYRIEDGELIRFFFIQSEYGTELLIISHHLAGDGKSITILLEDILKAMNGKKLRNKTLNVLQTKDIFEKCKLSLPLRLYINHINQKWIKCNKRFSILEANEVFGNYWKDKEPILLTIEFKETETKEIIDRCIDMDISVNSYLMTMILRSYNKNANIGFAIDIRNKNQKSMGNNASGANFKYKNDFNKSFEDNAKCVNDISKKLISSYKKRLFMIQVMATIDGSLLDSACVEAYTNFSSKISRGLCHLIGYDGNPRDLSTSNLKDVTINEEYGAYSMDHLLFIPPVIPCGKRLFGIVTFNDKLSFTMQYMNDNDVNESLIFRKAIKYIKEDINVGDYLYPHQNVQTS